ncbi:hypothetical protein TNCV_351381 [Trichonephila clavipes]|nr:hypothetical protein TNCV_351381 [Trichonephila clavipes]
MFDDCKLKLPEFHFWITGDMPISCDQVQGEVLEYPGASESDPQCPDFPMAFQNFPFLGHGSIFVNVCEDNVLCSSEGHEDFRLRRHGSLRGLLIQWAFWRRSKIAETERKRLEARRRRLRRRIGIECP